MKLKFAGFVRISDEWRFEGWLVEGVDFNPDKENDAESLINKIKVDVEKENGPDSYRTIAFMDGAREGKEGGTPDHAEDLSPNKS